MSLLDSPTELLLTILSILVTRHAFTGITGLDIGNATSRDLISARSNFMGDDSIQGISSASASVACGLLGCPQRQPIGLLRVYSTKKFRDT
ncbi:hypothetical protein BKA64DRAFT_61795 [Cadophora sp. MPI-SDFR-AT-0126]|nr:hypothetical protein BKA64DRAFT_61795 [Leotiomycetes sp. MPI-SDFR-AT-0126]